MLNILRSIVQPIRVRIKSRALKQIVTYGRDTQISGTVAKRAPKSSIVIGNDCKIEGDLVTETDDSRIEIGDNVYIGGATILDCVVSIVVEQDVLISYQCILADSDNHSLNVHIRRRDLADWKQGKHDWTTTNSAPIRICRGAWIGVRSIVLKGVTVGEGAVVAAASVVTKDVPPWTIVAGNPAKVVRALSDEEIRID